MSQQRRIKTESFLLFLPFAILAFSGAIDSSLTVYACFIVQIISLIILYYIEKGLVIYGSWKRILSMVFLLYGISLVCSAIGYSPRDSVRVTTLVYANALLLCINMAVIKQNVIDIFSGFIRWCSAFGCISILFSVYGLLFGSSFQRIRIEDTTIISSTVKIGPIAINQYAVQGGLVNGNLGVASWFTNPNLFSMICLITYIYCLYNKKYKFLLIAVIGIILGYSRAILVISLMVTFLYLFQSSKKWGKILLTFGLLIGFVIILFYGGVRPIDFNGRMRMWGVLLNYDFRHWFLPNGLGTSSLIIKSYGEIALSSHSLYINILTEYGLVGLLVFIYIMTKKGIRIRTLYSNAHTKNRVIVYRVLFVIMISLIVLGITEVTVFTFSFFNYLFFYVVFAISRGDISYDNSVYTNIQ